MTDIGGIDFDKVYSLYAEELWRFAARRTGSSSIADDLIQEVFTSLWIRRNSLQPDVHVRAYLYRILHNLIIDRSRHSSVVSQQIALDPIAVSGTGLAPEDPLQNAQNDEFDRALAAVIESLSEQQRALVELRWRQGLSFAEIADVLGITPAAAQKQGSRVLERLRAELKGFTEG